MLLKRRQDLACSQLFPVFLNVVQPRVPLSQGEFSAGLAGLILNKVWDQIMTHSYIGSSVAAHLIVVGC